MVVQSSTNFFSVTGIGNVIQLAYDGDGGNLWFGANGHWFEGNPSALSGPSYTGVTSTGGISPMLNRRTNDNGASINFGQKPFKYAPPKGFQTLNSANIRSEIEVRPDQYVGIVTYTGDGNTNRVLTGLKMQPDLVWIKSMSASGNHCLVDSVRGANERLIANGTSTESTNTGTINSFNSSGFTIGDSSLVNTDGTSYVAWCWKAGGAAVSNTVGSINSTVSANQDAGFSIVSYTGNQTNNATVGHGLGKVPDLIVVKNRTGLVDWGIWHSSLPSGQVLRFNQTEGQTPATAYFQDENNTSSVFALGTNDETNDDDGDTYIAYCWHNVPGLQKFGMYTGDGTADELHQLWI